MTLVGVLAFGTTSGAVVYQSLMGKRDIHDVDGLVLGAEEQPPPDPTDPFGGVPVNILVMGTDLRDAANVAIAGADDGGGLRSDTTMLVHVSADRQWIEIVSIPRDTWTKIPACNLKDGKNSRAYSDKFNASFGAGGAIDEDDEDALLYAAACTISTVQLTTGVTVTNHAVVKMNGVIGVVDAINGVRMCFPETMDEDDKFGSFYREAGEHTLDGPSSIQYLRARKGKGMGLEIGSDLTRIARQQAFINSMMRQILSAQTLADPLKVYNLASAALSSVSADQDLADPTKLAGLAWSLKDLDRANVIMTQLPVYDDKVGEQEVIRWYPEAQDIWDRIAADQPPPGVVLPTPEPAPGASGDASAPADGAAPPDDTAAPPADTAAPPADTAAPPVAPAPEPSLLPGVCG